MRPSCSYAALLLLSICAASSLAAESPSEKAEKLRASLQTWQQVKKDCGGNYSYKVRWSSFVGFGHETEIVVRDNKISERRFREFGGEPVAIAPVPVAPPAPVVVPRKWTDLTGDHSVEAEFAGVKDGSVRLKKQDGKTISVPMDKLSKADQAYVKSLDRPAPPPAKPEGNTWTETGEELGSHKKGAAPKTLDELYKEAQAILKTELQPHHRLYVRLDKQGLLLSCFYVDTRIMDDAPRTGVAITSIDVALPAPVVDPVPETLPAVAEPETSPPAVEEKAVIELRNADGEPGLKRLNQYTQIFSYSNDQTWLQLSFDHVPFTDKNVLKACRDSFKYCNVEVRFPARTTETSRVYAQLRGPLRSLGKAQSFTNMKDVKLTFTGFEDGRLKGTVSGTITRLTTRTEGPGLRTGDIAGVGHVDKDANIQFEVNFDLSID